MFIILSVILTIIAFSLRLCACSSDLANILVRRNIVKTEDTSKKFGGVAVSASLTATSSILRVSSFIVSRIRDAVLVLGGTIVIIEFIFFAVVSVCVVFSQMG